MIATDVTLQLACAVLVMLVPLGISLVIPNRHLGVLGAVTSAVVGAVVSIVSDVASSTTADLASLVLDAVAAGAFAVSVAMLVSVRSGARASIVIAALWSAVLYQPVFWTTVSSVPPVTQVVFGAVDFAAVLATHVSTAAMVATLTWLPALGTAPPVRSVKVSWARGALASALVVVGASGWMLGLERVLSESSGRIALNAVVGLSLGAAMWLIIAVIAGRRSGPPGLVAGAVAAWGAIGGGVAFLAPTALAASVILGTAAGAAVVVRARAGTHPARRYAIAAVVAVATGGVVLAILADGFGMAATGSLALVAAQLGALVAVTVIAVVATTIFWLIVRLGLALRRKAQPPAKVE